MGGGSSPTTLSICRIRWLELPYFPSMHLVAGPAIHRWCRPSMDRRILHETVDGVTCYYLPGYCNYLNTNKSLVIANAFIAAYAASFHLLSFIASFTSNGMHGRIL